MIKTYIPHSIYLINHPSKSWGINLDLTSQETIKTSHFSELPDMLLHSAIANINHFTPVLPELPHTTTKPNLSNLLNFPSYNNSLNNLDLSTKARDQETENSFIIENIINPAQNWLKETTIEDVIRFMIDNAPDIYSEISEGLKDLKELGNINLSNDVFYNTSSSEYFNGGIGNDTVVYSGKHDDYLIVATSQSPLGIHSGYKVIAITGNETDTLVNIEKIQFSDGYSDLGIIGSSEIFHPLV